MLDWAFRPSETRRLVWSSALWLALGLGGALAMGAYWLHGVQQQTVLAAPITSSSGSAELFNGLNQELRDLRAVVVALAHNSLAVQGVVGGSDRDAAPLARYLRDLRDAQGLSDVYWVTETGTRLYRANGEVRPLQPTQAQDHWYERLRSSGQALRLDVSALPGVGGALALQVQHRVLDSRGRWAGAAGAALAVDSLERRLASHERETGQLAFVTDEAGRVLVRGGATRWSGPLTQVQDLSALQAWLAGEEGLPHKGSQTFLHDGVLHLATVWTLPELGWRLWVLQAVPGGVPVAAQAGLGWLLAGAGLLTLGVGLGLWQAFRRYQVYLDSAGAMDSLTGLYPRRSVDILLGQAVREAIRQGAHLSVMLLAVDDVAEIRKREGHAVADAVLKELAIRLRDCVRSSDITCRWGHDAFLVLLKEANLTAAAVLAEGFRRKLQGNALMVGRSARVMTVSGGVTAYRPREPQNSFLERVERLLRQARKKGPGSLEVASRDELDAAQHEAGR